MIDITKKIQHFRGLLLTAWNWSDLTTASKLDVMNWVQASWEITIEHELEECILNPLYRNSKKQLFNISSNPTHKIVAEHIQSNSNPYEFCGFIDEEGVIALPLETIELKRDDGKFLYDLLHLYQFYLTDVTQ